MGRRATLVVAAAGLAIAAAAASPIRAADPFTRLVDGRAGGAWRGYRFEVALTAAPHSTPRDIERAYAAASSLALSGGNRDCTAAGRARRPELCAGAK